jgi:hypothetical protein
MQQMILTAAGADQSKLKRRFYPVSTDGSKTAEHSLPKAIKTEKLLHTTIFSFVGCLD